MALPELGLEVNGLLGSGANALASKAVDAAINSAIQQVATAGVSAVITGEFKLNIKDMVANAIKAGTFVAATTAIDNKLFTNAKGVVDVEHLSFQANIQRKVLQASAKSVIYGGDFKENVIAALGDSVAKPAFNYIGHTLKRDLGLNPKALTSKTVITTSHALVGGTIAKLSGGDFSSGAIATAVGHVVGEYAKDKLADAAIKGNISIEDAKTEILALSSAVSGATLLLT